MDNTVYGIELEEKLGLNDGSKDGYRYFSTVKGAGYGLFAPFGALESVYERTGGPKEEPIQKVEFLPIQVPIEQVTI